MAIDATLEPHLRATAPLTEYVWRYRYPGEPSEPDESEVRQALDRARAAVALVLGRVSAEAHPSPSGTEALGRHGRGTTRGRVRPWQIWT